MNENSHQKTTLEPLFPQDTGELGLETRRVLVRLLAGPYITATRHPKLWSVLVGQEKVIRQRLAELFLELVLDHATEVAFIRQAHTEGLEVPCLLRHTKLTLLDSVLMLYLRQCLMEADIRGERGVISELEMTQQLLVYEKSSTSDKAGFERQINTAIRHARERHVLMRISGSDDRYEISPILKLLFSAEEIVALKAEYAALLNKGVDTDELE